VTFIVVEFVFPEVSFAVTLIVYKPLLKAVKLKELDKEDKKGKEGEKVRYDTLLAKILPVV